MASSEMDLEQVNRRLRELDSRVLCLEGGDGDCAGGLQLSDAVFCEVLKKVSTRLQKFEALLTGQLSDAQAYLDSRFAQVDRDVGVLKDQLSEHKGEVNHIRRLVSAGQRDMEDMTTALGVAMKGVDVLRGGIESMSVEISVQVLETQDIQEELNRLHPWREEVDTILQQLQREERRPPGGQHASPGDREADWPITLGVEVGDIVIVDDHPVRVCNRQQMAMDIAHALAEMHKRVDQAVTYLGQKIDTKVDLAAWKETNDDLNSVTEGLANLQGSAEEDTEAQKQWVRDEMLVVNVDLQFTRDGVTELKRLHSESLRRHRHRITALEVATGTGPRGRPGD